MMHSLPRLQGAGRRHPHGLRRGAGRRPHAAAAGGAAAGAEQAGACAAPAVVWLLAPAVPLARVHRRPPACACCALRRCASASLRCKGLHLATLPPTPPHLSLHPPPCHPTGHQRSRLRLAHRRGGAVLHPRGAPLRAAARGRSDDQVGGWVWGTDGGQPWCCCVHSRVTERVAAGQCCGSAGLAAPRLQPCFPSSRSQPPHPPFPLPLPSPLHSVEQPVCQPTHAADGAAAAVHRGADHRGVRRLAGGHRSPQRRGPHAAVAGKAGGDGAGQDKGGGVTGTEATAECCRRMRPRPCSPARLH